MEGGEGASPVWVKDPILLIHGSLKEINADTANQALLPL